MEGHKQSVVQYLTKKMAEEAHKRRLCTNYKDLSNAAWKRISVETAASVPVSGTVEEVGTKVGITISKSLLPTYFQNLIEAEKTYSGSLQQK